MAENLRLEPFSESVTNFDDAFFVRLPTDLRFKKVTYQTYHPINPLNKASSVRFFLPAWTSQTLYLLHDALLAIKFKIVTKDGAALPDDSRGCPANNVLGSIFSDMKLLFNDKQVSVVTGCFNYKCYFENVLNYSSEVKTTWLQSQGYYEDTYGSMDNMGEGNEGFILRESLFSKMDGTKKKWSDKSVYFVGGLPSDLNSSGTPILNGINIRIEFTLSPMAFFLMTTEDGAKIELESVQIHVPCAEMSDELAVKIANRLKKEDALIPFRRRQITPYNIPKNTTVFLSDTLFPTTVLPSRIVLGFVEETSFIGTYTSNPYNLKRIFSDDCKIKNVSLSINGNSLDGLPNDENMLNYTRLFLFNDLKNAGISNSISSFMYNGGYFFATFDLSSGLNSGSIFQNPLTREGQIRASVTFSGNTPNNIVLLVYSEYPSLIKVTEDRRIETNYL